MFSVIERDRYHHSNIYSGAPMPFMQRITWSGVALHQGTGLGHVASHGCIRMPAEFAARLWSLKTMGMRVIISHAELRPVPFSDPHLFVHKEKSTPTAAVPAAVVTAQNTTTITDALDPPLRNRKFEASQTVEPAVVAPAQTGAAANRTAPRLMPTADLLEAAQSIAAGEERSSAGAPAQPEAQKPATEAAEITTGGTAPAAAATTAEPASVAATPAPATAPVAQSAPAATAVTVTPAATAVTSEPNKPVIANDALVSPLGGNVPMPLPKPVAAAHNAAPIAIFVSRKESKIYVRQNFAPVLEAPVTIDHRDQPLGTHVYTAMDYLDRDTTFRWTVVTLPGERPKLAHSKKHAEHGRHRRNFEADQELGAAPPVVSAQEALARIGISQDVIDQISQMIVPGSSLVISDQGLGPETGRGTDFVVVTR